MGSGGKSCTGVAGRAFLLALLTAGALCAEATAQLPANVSYRFRLATAAGSAGSLPFWLHANQYGVVDPSSANTIAEASVYTPFNTGRSFSLSYGIDAVGRVSDNSSTYLNAVYLKLKYDWLQLNGGRYKERLDAYGGDLSSGSYIWSGNTRPMYKVCLFTNDYVPVPFTNGFFSLRGSFGHGWFGNNRYIKDAYLHEKSLFGRFGGEGRRVNVFAGLMHFVMWGGYSDETGALPTTLSDFWAVILGEGAATEAPAGEKENRLGNHLGVWELGGSVDFGDFNLMLHKSTPFDDQSGLHFHNFEDGLYGVKVGKKDGGGVVDGVLWEVLYTKNQSGESAPHDTTGAGIGMDNYFNNYVYRDGWTYGGRILGTPLFSFDPLRTINTIYNNRVLAYHFGVGGTLFSTRYVAYYTYSQNYGTYPDLVDAQATGTDYRFDPPLKQHAWMLRLERPVSVGNRVLFLDATVAGDAGEMRPDGVGAMVGIKYVGMFGM
ncbi:MAG: capsule assembly Wzi family protein [Candidatus Latescibacterota bacterium]|jgi:hypothetical protein